MRWLNIYNKSKLPASGWIQQCFMCGAPTAKTQDYHKDEYTHTVYLCGGCQKEIVECNNKKEKYIIKVENYIDLNTPAPYAVPKISLSPPKISAPPPLLPRPHTINKVATKKNKLIHSSNNAKTNLSQEKQKGILYSLKLKNPPKKKSQSIFKKSATTLGKILANMPSIVSQTPDDPKPLDPLSPPSPNSEASATNFISMG